MQYMPRFRFKFNSFSLAIPELLLYLTSMTPSWSGKRNRHGIEFGLKPATGRNELQEKEKKLQQNSPNRNHLSTITMLACCTLQIHLLTPNASATQRFITLSQEIHQSSKSRSQPRTHKTQNRSLRSAFPFHKYLTLLRYRLFLQIPLAVDSFNWLASIV